ncbi:unnamed protein product, partial [Discosporangium mesarthrocarpum]
MINISTHLLREHGGLGRRISLGYLLMEMGLSAEDIHARLDELGEELQSVSVQIHATIKGQQFDVDGTFDCSAQPEWSLPSLKREVQGLARAVDRPETALGTLAIKHLGVTSRLAKQVARCQAVVDSLESMIQVEEALTSAEQCMSAALYLEAAEAMGTAESLIQGLHRGVSAQGEGEGGDKIVVLRALERLLRKRRTGLEGHLREVALAALAIGRDGRIRCRKVITGSFCQTHYRTPLDLGTVFLALQRMDLLGDLAGDLVAQLRASILDPLLRAATMATTTTASSLPPLQASSNPEEASLVCPLPLTQEGMWGVAAADDEEEE